MHTFVLWLGLSFSPTASLRRPTVYELLLGENEQERLEFLTSHGGRVRTVQPDYQVAGRTRLSVEMRPDVYERYRRRLMHASTRDGKKNVC